ncbi:MAG: hypothetical protein WC506_05505 [Candidatus Micrarchaeia archaeon]
MPKRNEDDFHPEEDYLNLPSQSSMQLVSEVNNFLDEIDKSGSYDEPNEGRILAYVRQMKAYGFNAPFSSLVSSTTQELDEAGELEVADQRKQNYYLRYFAGLKKMSLNRARVALSAHKAYRLAKQRLDSPAWLSQLPLGGNYIKRLFESGDVAIINYREYMDSFSSKSAQLSMALVTVEHEVEGFTRTSRFRLSNSNDLEKKVERAYGKGAKVLKVEAAKSLHPIIKNKSARVALFTAAACSAVHAAKAGLASQGASDSRLSDYSALLKKNGITPEAMLDSVEGYAPVKKQLAKAGFGTIDEDGGFHTDPAISGAIKSARLKVAKTASRGMADAVLVPLARFYSLKSKSGRESGGFFPSLVSSPAFSQLAVLELMEFAYPHTAGLAQAVWEKIEAEEGFPANSTDEYFIGFIASRGLVSKQGIAQSLAIGPEQVEKSVSVYSSLTSGRGAAFLSELGGAKKK